MASFSVVNNIASATAQASVPARAFTQQPVPVAVEVAAPLDPPAAG